MKRLLIICALLGVLILLLVGGVQADLGFKNKDFEGAYAFSFDGTIFDPFGSGSGNFPVVALGYLVADGQGNVTNGVRTLNVGGVVIPETFTCIYTVNSNGTGSASCSFSGNTGLGVPAHTESFTIVLQSQEKLSFVGTDANAMTLGVAERQKPTSS